MSVSSYEKVGIKGKVRSDFLLFSGQVKRYIACASIVVPFDWKGNLLYTL